MTVQARGTISVHREALAREGMRAGDASVLHDVSATTYLQIADNAVESRRQARAHLALERTEAALFSKSAPAGADSEAARSSTLNAVRDARYAVTRGDYGGASLLIRKALANAGAAT